MIHSLTLATLGAFNQKFRSVNKNSSTKKVQCFTHLHLNPRQKKAQKTPTKPKLNPPPFSHLHVMIVLIKASHKSSLRGITTFPPWRLKTAVVVRIHRFSCTTRWNLPDDIRVPRWSWNNQKLNPGKTQAKENVGHMCILKFPRVSQYSFELDASICSFSGIMNITTASSQKNQKMWAANLHVNPALRPKATNWERKNEQHLRISILN